MTVMQMLPATAYIKMIDVFLIFGQLYPFAEVILLTIMEYHREGDGSGHVETSTASQVDFPDTDSKDNLREENMDTSVKVREEQIMVAAPKTGCEPVEKLYWYKVTGESSVEIIQLIPALFRGKDTSRNYGIFLYWIYHHSLLFLPK